MYLGKDKAGIISYVGITNDIGRRGSEHKGLYDIYAVTGKITRLQALAIETSLILGARASGYKLNNKILSIAERNPIFKAAFDWVSREGRQLITESIPWQ